MSDKTDAVQRMQDYIEKHLGERITLTDLAEAAYFSPWYSAKVFKELVGLSPGDYIRKLRLTKSALLLRDGNGSGDDNGSVKITDLAFDMGFESVDGYQRAFRREFSHNPKEYSKNPVPLPLFTVYGVKFKELWKKERKSMENVKNVFVQLVDKPARKVILKRGIKADNYMSYCEEVGCDIWGVLTSMKSLCGEPVCLWLPEKYRKENTSEYVQGVEAATDFCGVIPDGFDIIDLPAAKYLMFQGEPFAEEDYCEAIEALQASVDNYDPSFIGYAYDDENPRIQLEPVGSRGYIELIAVKPQNA